MLSYEHEVETWYALYMTYNNDNRYHADFAFMAAGFQSAEEVHRANLNWLSEIFERIDYTAENIAEMEAVIPHAKELLQEYQSVERRKPSIRAQLAAAQAEAPGKPAEKTKGREEAR